MLNLIVMGIVLKNETNNDHHVNPITSPSPSWIVSIVAAILFAILVFYKAKTIRQSAAANPQTAILQSAVGSRQSPVGIPQLKLQTAN